MSHWVPAYDWTAQRARRSAIVDRMTTHGLLPQDEVFVHEPDDESLLSEPFTELTYDGSICFNSLTGTLSILCYNDLQKIDGELLITIDQLYVFHLMYTNVYENHIQPMLCERGEVSDQ